MGIFVGLVPVKEMNSSMATTIDVGPVATWVMFTLFCLSLFSSFYNSVGLSERVDIPFLYFLSLL